jgi:hypothetical protein
MAEIQQNKKLSPPVPRYFHDDDETIGTHIMLTNQIASVEALQLRRDASVLLEVLRTEGVNHILGNPGTTELPLVDALLDMSDITICEHSRRPAPSPCRWLCASRGASGFPQPPYRRRGRRRVHVRHEQVAALAADAKAHLTGELAVCVGYFQVTHLETLFQGRSAIIAS